MICRCLLVRDRDMPNGVNARNASQRLAVIRVGLEDIGSSRRIIRLQATSITLIATRIDPETVEITGDGFFEDTTMVEEMTPLPNDFNVPLREEHIVKTEVSTSSFPTPLLTNADDRRADSATSLVRRVAPHREE